MKQYVFAIVNVKRQMHCSVARLHKGAHFEAINHVNSEQ